MALEQAAEARAGAVGRARVVEEDELHVRADQQGVELEDELVGVRGGVQLAQLVGAEDELREAVEQLAVDRGRRRAASPPGA